MTASTIRLPSEPYGIFKATDIVADSVEKCNTLLDANHEKYHTFFRDPAFHNHMAHSLLTNLALGATPEEIVDRFNDLVPIMRQIPDVDQTLLEKLDDPEVFYDAIGQIHHYHTFLEFFTRQIDTKGWKAVVQEYVFARTKLANRMLAQVFEGAYHPLIHVGFGIEFGQPAIVAEGLSQAASHASMNIEKLFFDSEALAAELPQPSTKPKPLLQLVHEVHASEAIRNGPRWSDLADKMKNGTIGRSGGELTKIAAQFVVRGAGDDVEELERRTAEMISVCAYLAGSVLRADKKRKIEFFIMHAVTSSIFLTVLTKQDWVAPRDKARLVEWKGRLDLAWYATEGVPPLDETAISGYRGSEEVGWPELFIAARRESDDGHVSKFIRALKNGEIVAKKYEEGEWADYFPMKQGMWIKLARICLDTTTKLPWDTKWVWFAGFEEAWRRPDLAI